MSLRAEDVLTIFEQINRVPRCSKHEQQIAAWLLSRAKGRNLEAEQDEIGNVLIRVPATEGYEEVPTLVLQGHMDMVCEKTPESTHNFETDPVPVVRDGDWIHAEDTTLGADNGIAVALSIAIAESDIAHPALEILVTVDEETGLTGAQNLREGWLRGTRLLNIDSEDEGVFTVGCAGGRDSIFTCPVKQEPLPDNMLVRELAVSGLQGGHSGVDIHLGRANANVLLVRVIAELLGGADAVALRLASLSGGNAHNAIPRDASAVIAVPAAELPRVEHEVIRMLGVFRAEYDSLEPGLDLSLRSCAEPSDVYTRASAQKLVDLVAAIPHGVIRMSADVPGLVETSTNLATIRPKNDTVEIKTSQRSSYRSRLGELAARLESIARLAGAAIRSESSYPPWEPHMESDLLGRAVESYQKTFGNDPVVEVIHAGLECGVIGAKYPGMQMISYGPTVQNPHSPDERLSVSSLEKVCTFTAALLSSYADG